MYTVYILENANEQFYIGYTSKDVQERVAEHNAGKCQWTKNKGPWNVRYTEGYKSKEEAYRREKQMKRYKGGRAFKVLINEWRGAGAAERARLATA